MLRPAGRLVFISSTSARAGSPTLSLYCAPKWAQEGWAESIAYEVEPFGIKVVLVEPGAYDTAIWRTSSRISPPDSAYGELLRIVERIIDDVRVPRARDPHEVARAISRALTARKPRFRYSVELDAKINGGLATLPYRPRPWSSGESPSSTGGGRDGTTTRPWSPIPRG